MASTQEQSSQPKAETVMSALALLSYLFGGQGVSSLPAAQKGKYSGLMGMVNAPGASAGNIPGSILPNYQDLLGRSQQSFFNTMSPNALSLIPPPQPSRPGLNSLSTIFPPMR